MGGALTHISSGLIGALIVYFAFFKTERKRKLVYAFAIFFGAILPDLVDFGVLGIKMGSVDPSEIMRHPLFDTLANFGHTFQNWAIIALIFCAVMLFIYEVDKISKKNLITVLVATALLLLGILVHLRIDILVIETSYWI